MTDEPDKAGKFRQPVTAALLVALLLLSASAQPQIIIGIYHSPNCRDYAKVGEKNRVPFKNEAEAQAAGDRKARNCPE